MPDAVMQRLLDSVEHATEVCVATPVVVTGFAEKFYECVRIGESASLEMILPAQVFEQVHAAFPTLTNELMNGGERVPVSSIDPVFVRALDCGCGRGSVLHLTKHPNGSCFCGLSSVSKRLY